MAPERTALSARSIFGIAIVALGVLLTLSNLGLVEIDDLWEYWPVVFLLIGVAKISSREVGRGFFWLALGTAFLLPVAFEELEWDDLFDYWPLFLIALGARLVARSFSPRPGGASRHGKKRASEEAPDVEASAVLCGLRRTVTAADFQRGNLTAVMGACDLDLTAAKLAPGGAVIEIFAFWGGVVLRIPDDWQVDPQVAVLMGGLVDNTEQRAATGGRMTVKGLALMGGLELRN